MNLSLVGDCLMAKFTRKEIMIADVLLELVDLIHQFHRQNPKLAIPAWNTKRSRCLPRQSHFVKAGLPISLSSPSPISPPAHHPSKENLSKSRKDGLIIDLNKDPEEIFVSKDVNYLPSEKPFRSHKGFKEESYIDANTRNSEEIVLLDSDKFEVDIIMNVQSSKPTLKVKKKREESMISSAKLKKMRVDAIPFLHP